MEVINRATEILEVYEEKDKPKEMIVQTTLPLEFVSSANEIEEKIKSINVLEITPIQALNILYELKEKIK